MLTSFLAGLGQRSTKKVLKHSKVLAVFCLICTYYVDRQMDIVTFYFQICTYYTDLKKQIRDCFSPEPQVQTLEAVHDIKTWIATEINEVHGHSVPLCFKFEKDEQRMMTEMYSRRWSTSEWQNHGALLKVFSTTCISLPVCVLKYA